MEFIYRGISSGDMGIVLSMIPPLPLPQRRKEKQYVPDRSGYLTYDNRVFDEFTFYFEGHVIESDTTSIQAIKTWLLDSGRLIHPLQTSGYYNAEVMHQTNFTHVAGNLYKFSVMFVCQPFLYSIQNSEIVITESPFTVNNEGNIFTEPIITLVGTGQQSITVNGYILNLDFGEGRTLTLDSELDVILSDLTSGETFVEGELPVLDVGVNLIEFTSGITSFTLLPNWRNV